MSRRESVLRRVAGSVIAVAAGFAFAIGAASVAQAKWEYHDWNSAGNPLIATGYGSTVQAYGKWRIADGSNGTGSFLDSYTYLYNADNHKKYATEDTLVNAGICFAPEYTSCQQSYYEYQYTETNHSNASGTWDWLYANTGLPATADYARAAAKACIDVPFRTDPCAGPSYTTGSQY